MNRLIVAAAIAGAGALVAGQSQAAIVYSSVGSTFTEDFNSLPTAHPTAGAIPNNASLQPTPYSGGWADDSTSSETNISLPGWHLFHQTAPVSEGGANGNQRLRYGDGANGTGSFYAFASASSAPDKAMGIISSNTIQASSTRAYIGLQLINNTGTTLTGFTVTYDGEQWRDAGVTPSNDVFDFQWTLIKNDANWSDSSGYSGIANSFVPPKDTAAAGALDGNAAANRVADISHTVTTFNPGSGNIPFEWLAGAELWIRWRDGNVSGNDDGIGIDNVRFTAVPEPAGLAALALGAMGLMARRRRA